MPVPLPGRGQGRDGRRVDDHRVQSLHAAVLRGGVRRIGLHRGGFHRIALRRLRLLRPRLGNVHQPLAVGHEAQVHVHGGADARHLALGGILPELEVVEAGGGVAVLGEPELVVRQLGQVHLDVSAVFVEVDHGGVPRLRHLLAEGVDALGDDPPVHAVGPGVVAPQVLPVAHHRVGDVLLIRLQPGQEGLRLLLRLRHGDGVGEVVGPHVNARGDGPLHVPHELGVLHQHPSAPGPVARPDDGEVDAVRRHRFPVDDPLVAGHVDALGEVAAGVHQAVAVVPAELPPGEGGGGHVLQLVYVVVVEADHALGGLAVAHPPDDGGHLLPGDGLVGAEGAGAVLVEEAVHDPLFKQLHHVAVLAVIVGGGAGDVGKVQGPGGHTGHAEPGGDLAQVAGIEGVHQPVVQGQLHVGHGPVLSRLGGARLVHADGQQDQLEGLPPGDVAQGLEGAVGVALYHALPVEVGHVLVGPVVLGQIGKQRPRRGQGGGAGGGRQQDGQQQDGDAFFHVRSFSLGQGGYSRYPLLYRILRPVASPGGNLTHWKIF